MNKKNTISIPSFDSLPDSAWARENQLATSPRFPGRPVPLPFSTATLRRKVRLDPDFPKPVKLGERITAWKVGDIRAWLAAQQANCQPA